MHINDLPQEILSEILSLTAHTNQTDGVQFTYGLTQPQLPVQKPSRLSKYVRGPLSTESLKWDATQSIRQVCGQWHDWAVAYNLEHVFERRGRGSERWAELSSNRRKYGLYELIEKPSGSSLYRDPLGSLKHTDQLLNSFPLLARNIRRLWFNGLYSAESDKHVLSIVSECTELQFLSVPWTILRRGTAEDWIDLLNVNTDQGSPLHSLELQAVCLTKDQAEALKNDASPNPLKDPRVDFSALKRLKIFGNTPHKPICDYDLSLMARTATNLEALDFTNLSTISVAGMLTLVRASRTSLQVLEHSPRSDDGFYHPFPGNLHPDTEHICHLLTSLPRMRDLSISVPYMCSALFSSGLGTDAADVQWEGECQVRTTDMCGCTGDKTQCIASLRHTFGAARTLIAARNRVHRNLAIEIFFSGCIFEPEKRLVHGDFVIAQLRSNSQWPSVRYTSTKGPYGTTGVYGKDDEGNWDAVSEEDYLYAVEKGWIEL